MHQFDGNGLAVDIDKNVDLLTDSIKHAERVLTKHL